MMLRKEGTAGQPGCGVPVFGSRLPSRADAHHNRPLALPLQFNKLAALSPVHGGCDCACGSVGNRPNGIIGKVSVSLGGPGMSMTQDLTDEKEAIARDGDRSKPVPQVMQTHAR
jgi:hypothetical protein